MVTQKTCNYTSKKSARSKKNLAIENSGVNLYTTGFLVNMKNATLLGLEYNKRKACLMKFFKGDTQGWILLARCGAAPVLLPMLLPAQFKMKQRRR